MAYVQDGSIGWLTSMSFFEPLQEHDGEKPYYSSVPFTDPEAKQTNYTSIDKQVRVQDVRGHEDKFKFDDCGFELAHHKTAFSDWQNGASVKRDHYDEIEAFLKEKFHADRVIIFDHSVVLWSSPVNNVRKANALQLRRTGITNANAKAGEEYSAPPSSRPHVGK